ncbi:MAG: hypothetical protein ABJG68_14915 [Crocinitomicaceae bacterium]
MKKLIFLGVLATLTSCNNDTWNGEEKTAFKTKCLDAGGSSDYCDCYMQNAMNEYPEYEQMDQISFEEAVELSIGCE